LKQDRIDELADRIAAQLKRGTTSLVSPAPSSSGRLSSFLWGAATVAGLFMAAPLLRPLVREAVKGSLRVGRYAKEMASTAKEELEDITAEAEEEVRRES
jgi:hypothetical protein